MVKQDAYPTKREFNKSLTLSTLRHKSTCWNSLALEALLRFGGHMPCSSKVS